MFIHLRAAFVPLLVRWPRLEESVMHRSSVRPPVRPSVCLSCWHTYRDSPGGSMWRAASVHFVLTIKRTDVLVITPYGLSLWYVSTVVLLQIGQHPVERIPFHATCRYQRAAGALTITLNLTQPPLINFSLVYSLTVPHISWKLSINFIYPVYRRRDRQMAVKTVPAAKMADV